jgi:hydrogenase maturation protease
MKTIVLGVGNPILCDDGVGIHVAEQLKKQFHHPNVIIDEALTGGMNLLDLILGYDKAIIIDAVKMTDAPNGAVRTFSLKDISATVHSCNPHDVSLTEAIQMAEKLGERRIPQKIVVIGISMKEMSCEFGENLSKQIAAAIPKAVEMTLAEIKKDMNWSKEKLT